jgi:hypothetical protein
VYLDYGRVYLWDGFSKQHDGLYDMQTYLRYAWNQGGVDYVVGGFAVSDFSQFFINSYSAFEPYKKAIKDFTINKEKFYISISNE